MEWTKITGSLNYQRMRICSCHSCTQLSIWWEKRKDLSPAATALAAVPLAAAIVACSIWLNCFLSIGFLRNSWNVSKLPKCYFKPNIWPESRLFFAKTCEYFHIHIVSSSWKHLCQLKHLKAVCARHFDWHICLFDWPALALGLPVERYHRDIIWTIFTRLTVLVCVVDIIGT